MVQFRLRPLSGLFAMGRNILAGIAFGVGLVLPAAGQDAGFGRDVWLKQANCSDCHGWFGTGLPEDPRSPKGANLRQTKLDAARIAETVLCGRPGTAMPYFDQRAYTDGRCFGMTKEQMGENMPGLGGVALTRRHADGLAQFILNAFAGKGDPTFEECEGLLGAGNRRCPEFPRQAR